MSNIEDFKPYVRASENPNRCNVFNKDNTQVVTMPDGTVIPAQVWSRVFSSVEGENYVIVKLLVNIK